MGYTNIKIIRKDQPKTCGRNNLSFFLGITLLTLIVIGVIGYILFDSHQTASHESDSSQHTSTLGSRAHGHQVREVNHANDPATVKDTAVIGRDAKPTSGLTSAVPGDDSSFSNAIAKALCDAKEMERRLIFKNPSDQLLAMAVTDKDMPPIPVGPVSQQDFLDSLKTPILINSDDSDEVRELKELVIAAREEMKSLIESGESYQSVLEELQQSKKEEASVRMELQQHLREIFDSGDEAGAIEYFKTANERLIELGLRGLRFPMTHDEAMAFKKERARQKRLKKQQEMEVSK